MAEPASSATLDVAANRKAAKYTRKEMLIRLLWIPGQCMMRFTPRTAFGLRATILRAYGARVGRNVHIYRTSRIYIPFNLAIDDDASIGEWALVYNLGPVSIGKRCTVSHQAHICAGTHDHRDRLMPLMRCRVTLEADSWVCADAFVGPDVTIGQGAVVGARAVVVSDVTAWTVVAGSPAKQVGTRSFREE